MVSKATTMSKILGSAIRIFIMTFPPYKFFPRLAVFRSTSSLAVYPHMPVADRCENNPNMMISIIYYLIVSCQGVLTRDGISRD